MFSLFKSDPTKKLKKEYAAKLEQAMLWYAAGTGRGIDTQHAHFYHIGEIAHGFTATDEDARISAAFFRSALLEHSSF